jgi:FMN-dependent NADH-azoreductase
LPLQEIILTTLLYIQASPRGSESKSIQVADAYLETLRAQNPMIEFDTIKLWEEDLLSFDETQAAAKMKVMTGQVPTGAEKPAWDEITAVANRFIAADRYLLAVPMWNSGIPYRLKC